MSKTKSFSISKKAVWEAYQSVKRNKGAAGVDSQSLEDFEKKLKDNLYKIWNRMTSGSYFPPPVRRVTIPKKGGGERHLGIPTVADRIAQAVVKMHLEPKVEPHFHPDSYGYRPMRSAIDAVGKTRKRCWRYDWVIDLDIKGFFDNIDHELMMRAVSRYTDEKWILVYVERWLKAPVQLEDGTLEPRDMGTPQGGVISPLLANIFLHLAFDGWMDRQHPDAPFERYADDIVVHCVSEEQAKSVFESIRKRLEKCKLQAHPDKTKIVYCKDDDRPGSYKNCKFDFLGYTFRARGARNRWGKKFVGFLPAVSNESAKAIRDKLRSLRTHRRTDLSLEEIARKLNPVIAGWIGYFGCFYRSALRATFVGLNRILRKWAIRKYRKFKGSKIRAEHWLGKIARRERNLFAHWRLLSVLPTTG